MKYDLISSWRLISDSYEAVGLGILLCVCSVLLVVLFVFWGWKSFNDLKQSERSMALRAIRGKGSGSKDRGNKETEGEEGGAGGSGEDGDIKA